MLDPTDELPYLSATTLLERFRTRELSPVELMESVLRRADAVEPELNAFTARFDQDALAAARAAEERYSRGSARPLEGLPVAIKELTPVAGQQHTLGSLALADNIAAETAPSVSLVLEAGGIVHARSATAEFGCASHTFSRVHGLTRNPWNRAYGPAGSSGGSAAALAAGTTVLAQGSDSAGSLRLPAAACGVVGFKPPHGVVPGLPPLSLERCHHDGPMTRTVDDCALLYGVMAAADPRDPLSLRPRPSPAAAPDGVEDWRIAFSPGSAGLNVDGDVLANLGATVEALRAAGAHVDAVDLGWDHGRIVEATRLHYAATYGPMVQRVADAAPDLVTSYALEFVEQQRAYYPKPGFVLEANELAMELWAPVAEVFERYRVLLLPTLALPAAPAGGEGCEYGPDGPVVDELANMPLYWTVGLTVPFNLCSWTPAMSVPSGMAGNGVPTGVQIVGPPYDDAAVFATARAIERERPWPHRPPDLT